MAAAVLGWLVGVTLGSVGGADQPLLLSSALSSAYLSSRLVTQSQDSIQHSIQIQIIRLLPAGVPALAGPPPHLQRDGAPGRSGQAALHRDQRGAPGGQSSGYFYTSFCNIYEWKAAGF